MWHNLPFGRATPWFRYGVPRPLRVPVPLSYARRGVCARNPRPDRKSDCPGTKRSRAPAPGGRGTEARLGESPGAGGMCVGTWLMCGGELGKGCEVGSARTPVPTRTPVPRSLVPALLGIEAAFLRHVCAALHHQAHAGGNPAPPGVSSPFAATPGRNAGAHSAASLAVTPTRPAHRRGENTGFSREASRVPDVLDALDARQRNDSRAAPLLRQLAAADGVMARCPPPRRHRPTRLTASHRHRRHLAPASSHDSAGTRTMSHPRPAQCRHRRQPRSSTEKLPPATGTLGPRRSAGQAQSPRRPTERHTPFGRRRFRRLTPPPRSPCRGPASSVPAGRASRSGGCVRVSDRVPCPPRSGCARGRRRCRTAS